VQHRVEQRDVRPRAKGQVQVGDVGRLRPARVGDDDGDAVRVGELALPDALDWNTTPRSVPGPSTSRPAMTTPPVLGAVSPITMESTVDLPQPEWPTIETNSPSRTWSVKSRTISAGPAGVG
jgi:hypothetical protein